MIPSLFLRERGDVVLLQVAVLVPGEGRIRESGSLLVAAYALATELAKRRHNARSGQS